MRAEREPDLTALHHALRERMFVFSIRSWTSHPTVTLRDFGCCVRATSLRPEDVRLPSHVRTRRQLNG